MSNEIHCPKCNSTQITAQKHGFSAGKAVAGAVLTGGIGLLAGLHGSSNVDITCLACGKVWNPKKLAEDKNRELQQKQDSELRKWKNNFYNAYEAGKIDEAEVIYLTKSNYHSNAPDIHSAYKFHKKSDRDMNIIMVIFMSIILFIVYLIFR